MHLKKSFKKEKNMKLNTKLYCMKMRKLKKKKVVNFKILYKFKKNLESHKTNEEIDDSSSKASEETKEITKNEESELKSKSEILSTKSKKSQENDIFLIENIL